MNHLVDGSEIRGLPVDMANINYDMVNIPLFTGF